MNEASQSPHADFHTHSTASDGTLAPAELIRESAQRGLRIVALTDHDTIQGVSEAVATGHELDVRVIAGIEFSASIERGELHLLGYGVDPDDRDLGERLASLRASRRERAERIAERLGSIGIHLPEDLLTGIATTDSVGRPHIARALIEMGVVQTVSEGFDRYLGRGKPGFVRRELIDPVEAIHLIARAGGVAVMAHPFSVPALYEVIPRLKDAGLSGIECYYGAYDSEQRAELVTLASNLGLLATGGSDYHGPGAREGRELGAVDIPAGVVASLLDAVEQAR